MNFNPVLSEIQGLSPEAQGALGMAGHALAQNAASAAPPGGSGMVNAQDRSAMVGPSGLTPAQITPQVKAAAMPQDAGSAPAISPMRMADSNPVPSLGAPAEPNIHVLGSSPLGTLQGDKDELQRKLTTGSGESQISSRIQGTQFGQNHPMLGKILGGVAQGAATLGDIGLSTIAPQVAINLPGTAYHHQMLVNEGNHQVAADEANTEKEAQTRNLGAETAAKQEETTEAPQKANDAHELSQSSQGNLDSETATRQDTLQNPALIVGHAHAVDKAIREGRDPSADPMVQAYEKQIQGLQPKPKPAAPKTTDIKGPDGKVHTMGYDDKTNKFDIDEGESGFKPAVTNVNAGANREFQEQERGRGLLDKAEGSYRTAQQGASTMRDMVASARGGNKMSAQVLPLEGALAITTAQGVHRINRTEVDQYAGAGSLYDKIVGSLGKVGSGQPVPPNILDDIEKLTALQEKGAYGTYKGAYDSATRRYGLKNEQALPEPGGNGQASTPQPSGLAVSLADARQLPQNKGKSDADITADIKAHGHEVKP